MGRRICPAGCCEKGSRKVRSNITIWFPALLLCGALSFPLSFILWCAGNQTTVGGVRCSYFGRARWSQLLVGTLRGLTLLPGAHSPTCGTNPLHADCWGSHHGSVCRIRTFGHHQVWWLSQWRAHAAASHRKENSGGRTKSGAWPTCNSRSS